MPDRKTESASAAKSSQYIEIPIPKFNLKNLARGNYTPILVIALIIASFLLGMLTTKVQYLEGVNKPSSAAQAAQAAQQAAAGGKLSDVLIAYADELDMDTDQFSSCLIDKKYAENVTKDLQDGQTAGVSGTPGTLVNGILMTGALPFEEFKKLIDQELTGVPAVFAEGQELPAKVTVDPGHLPVLGDANAPVTIVEFSDFQCPFCKSYFDGALAQIKTEYVDTGKVKFAFRHYPLTSIHPNAQMTGEASECANEQDKFWEYHDLLFERQDAWTNLSSV